MDSNDSIELQGNTQMKTLGEIKRLMAAGETAKADEALKELLANEPDNLQAKMLYGTCRQLLGDEATFRRIHDELAPVMEAASRADERCVSMWRKYHALWLSLIVGGLVLAGTATALVHWGRQMVGQMEPAAAYRGPVREDTEAVLCLYAGPPETKEKEYVEVFSDIK